MSFNCPKFIEEFKQYVSSLGVINSALEVGCYSGELKDAINADGIDLNPKREDVKKCDIRDFKSGKKYDLVFSSGLLEHYFVEDAIDILKAMASVSNAFVLNYVPNTNCLAYKNAKKKTNAEWKNESDFTEESLAKLHEEAGLKVIETGTAGKEWAKRFGSESSEPYLVYCLAQKKVGRKKWQAEESNIAAEFAIPEE